MHRELTKLSRGLVRFSLWLLPLFTALVSAAPLVQAEIDASINQTVWKILYGVSDAQLSSPTWLAQDDDGDGLTNGAELAAGTNPFKATSSLAVSAMTMSSTAASLTFPTAAGKFYVVQSTANLANAGSWTSFSPSVQIIGDGAPKTLTVPQSGGSVFYRVLVQDTDTDGDGVSDWAEKVTGFDPNSAHTHGATQDDHAALAADLLTENVVTVTATKPNATQPPDAATAATDTGTFTITRGGTLHFSSITVPLNWSGTALQGVDYASLPTSVTFPAKTGVITLTAIPLANSSRQTSATVTLLAMPGGGYTVAGAKSASVVIAPAGNTSGTGLTGYYFNSTSTLINKGYSAALFDPATLKLTRLDPTVDFTLASGASPGTGVNSTYYTARWVGQVQPQYSETYYFDTKTDDGVKLWVNGQLLIDGWSLQTADRLATIKLQAGVLYDIKMEFYQATSTSQAHLYWYSDSQSKQVIPANRLYPATATSAPPAIISAQTAIGFVNQPFTFTVSSSNSLNSPTTFALGANSRPLPAGLTLNASTGVISGTPTEAGDFQVSLTASNAFGVGASALDIQILNAGSGVTRELWQSGVTGPNISDLPLTATPTSIDTTLAALEDSTAYPDNTGERLRGYFTPPATGNYYYWLAANNAAELWISDNGEPVNKIRRAWVTAPGTASKVWNDAGQPNQKSAWLSLVAGQTYYYEVLHNCGTGSASDNVAVGWFMDPTGTAVSPIANGSAVVPGYVLSKYDYPAATVSSGTLYVTNLSPQGASVSTGVGSADLRMNPSNTQAVLHFNYSGLTSPRTAYHIHAASDATGSGPIVFDLDDVDKFHPELRTADGGYIWNIIDVGALTAAQVVAAVQQGNAYFNVHTVNFPNGEIRGNLGLVQGSQNPPTLAADPGYTNDSGTDAGAARFLNQATFGAHPTDVTNLKSLGYSAWIDNQFTLSATHLLPDVLAHITLNPVNSLNATRVENAWWRAAVTAPDQLRQRMAFALSEIMVVSTENATLSNRSDGIGSFYDTLADNAFGNFRDLLKAVTLHPTMGYYLNMQGNDKGNLTTGLHPNENYAREIMQLFSLGLNRLWPDGTLMLDSTGNLIPTYGQDDIQGMARVFTGWTWNQALQSSGRLPTSFSPAVNYIDPMVLVPTHHELGSKAVLNNVVLPAAIGYNPPAAVVGGSQADPTSVTFDTYCSQDLEKALDNIFYHPNVGPYICRQLIQRLVTSNPSPAYLYRVVQKFNDDGTAQHVRGNMQAVVKAILLDGEARNVSSGTNTSGKQREQIMRIAGPARTFPFMANSGTFSQNGALATTITTTVAHHLTASDVIALDFTGNATGTPPTPPWNNPTTGSYTVLSSPAPTATTFAVNATGLTTLAYAQAINSNTITVTAATPGTGTKIYLKFLTGGAPDGIYTVTGTVDATHFTADPVASGITPPTAARTGNLLLPKISGGYVISKAGTPAVYTLTVIGYVNNNLQVNDHVWLAITVGTSTQLVSAEAIVASVIDENHFTVATTATGTETNSSIVIYPLLTPPLTRSGNVAIAASKFDMGSTTTALGQTPLDSPTVFNFFYPDYKYPGPLAANNVTTPEFQLTTDTNIVTLTNTLSSTILTSNNLNGLSTFASGAINLDLGPYMTAPYSVADVNGVTALVNKLGDLLTGGQLTPSTKSAIVSYVANTTNFPTTSSTYVRDRTRAIVQMILISPEYAIQR